MCKRYFAIFLAIFFILGTLVGCSGSETAKTTVTPSTSTNTDTKTDVKTDTTSTDVNLYGDTGGLKLPITTKDKCVVTWLSGASSTHKWNDTPFTKEIKKRTGIDLEIQIVPSEVYLEKVNTSLASRDMPNIMNLNVAMANTYGEQGAFLAYNKYLDKIPNFKAIIIDDPAYEWYMKSYATESGNIYGWPIKDLSRKVNHMYMYRKDIFDKHSLSVWKAGDTEGFYQILKTLKELYPNSVPMSSKLGNSFWQYQQAGWGIYGGVAGMTYSKDTGEWRYSRTTPEFKDMLDFFKRLYKEGLLDPEFMTNTSNAWIAKMAAPETTFVAFDWISRLDLFKIQVKDELPDYELSPGPPIGPTGKTYQLSDLNWFGPVVSSTTPNNMEALQLLDYLFSPSGATLNTIGVEGEWFNFDENGKPVYTDPELASLEKIDITNLQAKYGIWNAYLYVRCDRRSVYHALTPKEQEANDIIVNNNLFVDKDPILSFNDDILGRNNEILTNLDTKAFEFATKYVMEDSYGNDDWERWLKEAKALGVDELVKNYNDAQIIYNKK